MLIIFHAVWQVQKKGGCNVKQWNSNDQSLLHRINVAEGNKKEEKPSNSIGRGESISDMCPSSLSPNDVNKILCIAWHTVDDCLSLDLRPVIECVRTLKPTKWSLLEIAAKIFDPLGCHSLFTINIKVLFKVSVAKINLNILFERELCSNYFMIFNKIERFKGIFLP